MVFDWYGVHLKSPPFYISQPRFYISQLNSDWYQFHFDWYGFSKFNISQKKRAYQSKNDHISHLNAPGWTDNQTIRLIMLVALYWLTISICFLIFIFLTYLFQFFTKMKIFKDHTHTLKFRVWLWVINLKIFETFHLC